MTVSQAFVPISLLLGSVQSQAVRAMPEADLSLTALLWHYGQCVVGKKHDEVKAFLAADAPTGKADRWRVPSEEACLRIFDGNAQVTFTVDSYRGALANALVQHDFRERSGIGPLRIQSRVDAPAKTQEPQGNKNKATTDLRQRWEAENATLGACTVRANPEAARLWILTAPDSGEDLQQAKALTPAFQQCAKAASIVRYDFDREVMRGPVALAYLRLAK